jgi:subtilisin family serine protease
MHHMRAIAVGTACAAALSINTPAFAKKGDKIEGSYICVFKKGTVQRANVRAEANRSANQAGGRAKHVYENSVRGFSAEMSGAAAAQAARRNPNIAFCEQDQEVSIDQDAFTFRQVGKPVPQQPPQSVPWGVTRVNGVLTASSGTAWVIDTGIDQDHPDLNVDTVRSRNFVTRESSPDDLNGHGTHVAGTIAARNNSIGVIGVVPGTQVVAVRVLNRKGSGSNSDVIAGVDYVAGAGSRGDVANMSLTGGISEALDQAVLDAAATGVKFTLAAGNQAISATERSPARVNGPNVYTVSAFAQGDTWASFSNFGNPPIDFGEPGVSIPSTYKDGGYATASGTSMAAPHLAGILLAGSVKPDGTVANDPDPKDDTIGVH